MSTLDTVIEEIVTFCATEEVSEVSREIIDTYIDTNWDDFTNELGEAIAEKLPNHNIEVID